MDRLPYTYLLTLCCFTFVCIHGKDAFPCEVELMVSKGTTWKTAPQKPLTVRCLVIHCGISLNVTWCKLLDTNTCVRINYTENVEIRQNDKRVKDELISYLTFTRISIHDNGLYRCTVKAPKYQLISHYINISVSDLNQGLEISDYNADGLPSTAGDEDVPLLPYFSICLGVALLVFILTVLTHLGFYGWKRQLNHREGPAMQEKSTHMIPDLPKGSAPSTLTLHYTYSPSTAERPPSQPPLMTNGNKPAVTNTAEESQVSDRVLYAVVNHRRSEIPVTEQHAATKPNKNAVYAAINVS
ncbi:uncharacterized protein si:ch211-214p13.8 isoform X2 [Anoplopoma fimbria]|uniref:uncharacterized protein si:ch211-214p13.8 isoform X2 n=1 Tax=Anoplopoma fimbria TaxID=229290 RepID=UPI0023ED8C12|nr:uncharacterized protein si:ch211-214p13.8 isoform X2 [Anoplopoma fimbria]